LGPLLLKQQAIVFEKILSWRPLSEAKMNALYYICRVKTIVDFIRLLRPVNLAIIAATMYIIRWLVIYPLINNQAFSMEFQLNELDFFMSTMVMVCLAAAGNIINDYFDLKVDRINKPNRIIVGNTIKRRIAMVSHHVFNVLAVLLSICLAWRYDQLILAVVPAFMAGSLWYYSILFKKQVLIGNFVVALMVAIVPLWAGAFDLIALNETYGPHMVNGTEFFGVLWQWILGFALFAFVITLIREAQKDLEDIKGDAAGKFRTLPIKYGVSTTKMYIGLLSLLCIIGVLFVAFSIKDICPQPVAFWSFLMVFAVLPLIGGWYITVRGKGKKDYHLAATLSKIAMAGGILMAWFFH
jgi:4-hydroxybenzoate polyprenyltransferase